MATASNNRYGRRRSIVQDRTRLAKEREQRVESQLSKGICPTCDTRIGRGVRKHYEFCSE